MRCTNISFCGSLSPGQWTLNTFSFLVPTRNPIVLTFSYFNVGVGGPFQGSLRSLKLTGVFMLDMVVFKDEAKFLEFMALYVRHSKEFNHNILYVSPDIEHAIRDDDRWASTSGVLLTWAAALTLQNSGD